MGPAVSKYEIDFLKVGDADAILLHFFIEDNDYVVLIDAGNVTNADMIKNHMKKYYGTTIIDLAICTHPDTDHKGGFFGLLNDDEVKIKRFWLTDPGAYFTPDDVKRYQLPQNVKNAVRQIWNHPTDPNINLIDLIISNNILGNNVCAGVSHDIFPLRILAPTKAFYKEHAIRMIADYGVYTYEESDTVAYDENALPEKSAIKSVIDEDEDQSPYNATSLVIQFNTTDGAILFAGDANCASLKTAMDNYGDEIKGLYLLKVPHHGSKHNMTTEIIKHLSPKQAIISAVGSRKHPSSGIVYWINQYGGKVFSTHKEGSIHHNSNMPVREGYTSCSELTYKK